MKMMPMAMNGANYGANYCDGLTPDTTTATTTGTVRTALVWPSLKLLAPRHAFDQVIDVFFGAAGH